MLAKQSSRAVVAFASEQWTLEFDLARKTTLLAAKLALLSRTWKSRARGVCVISHTNAAREEIEKLLAAHPSAGAFLGYPHFVGTVTARNMWRNLSATEASLSLKVRRLLRDRILLGEAPWEATAWETFCRDLRTLLALSEPNQMATRHMAFDVGGATKLTDDKKANQQVIVEGHLIHLGSIHSVKGRSVDAIMVVETEVFRGMGADQRTMDMATVLPHAFGIESRDFTSRAVDLAAATNVFVGITRPRHFLALAMRKSAATTELIESASAQQWKVRDLTRST